MAIAAAMAKVGAASTAVATAVTPSPCRQIPKYNASRNAFFGKAPGLCSQVSAYKTASTRQFTVKAMTEKFQVIEPLNGDPFVGGLETPVTSSPLIAWYLSNLPAYRTAVSPLLRGVEVGLAHGFLLVGPFVKAGPLRNTEVAGAAGSLGAAGLIVILSVALTIYGIAQFKEGAPSIAPSLTLTGRKKVADKLQTAEGWASFAGGFFFGGLSGVAWAYYLLFVLQLPYPV
ncbi:hypothetical protein O6H91_12G056500 [Diphasiastrum complanatum]|uniref:Uncharacterized protein n=1 Tax=Diphasiastrum complanatum TaxID=34168 RepID=A0ACC2C250_DIPCM|nr:hypothetical protein O6H91_Y303500 [Diphasiastrum complanatum]KAJ7536103.1 hypothetical protein O6H91_12G056500 [Diphasiastrum complanatum]